jgi:hypothetical protein
MLHKVNRPDCEAQMKSIYRLQYKVLAFACSPQTRLPLNDPKVFTRKFGQQRGAWLFQRVSRSAKFNTALCNLIQHVNGDAHKRRTILRAFLNDTRFHLRLNDGAFGFQYRGLEQQTKGLLKDLMELFYDYLLDTGFPTNSPAGGKFAKHDFRISFWSANAGLDLCPACDGPKPEVSENDHFFPKSVYPFLAVHFSNLLPICKYCNQSFKQSTDPIDDHQHSPLSRSFYPYELPAVEYINVSVLRSAAGERTLEVTAKAAVDADRAKNLDRLLKLQTRWDNELKAVIGRLIEDLSDYYERLSQAVSDDFPTLLKDELRICERKKGRRYGQLLIASYLQFVSGNAAELQQLHKEVTRISQSHHA